MAFTYYFVIVFIIECFNFPAIVCNKGFPFFLSLTKKDNDNFIFSFKESFDSLTPMIH